MERPIGGVFEFLSAKGLSENSELLLSALRLSV